MDWLANPWVWWLLAAVVAQAVVGVAAWRRSRTRARRGESRGLVARSARARARPR
jgi:hypothetical protein